jgi:hypothetical protein
VTINLTPSETTIFFNDEEIAKERALIRKEKDRELLEYSFGEQLVGFMTGIALAHRSIPAVVARESPQFSSWNDLAFVQRHNLEDVFMLCCFPFSTFDMRGSTHCFDLFKRYPFNHEGSTPRSGRT